MCLQTFKEFWGWVVHEKIKVEVGWNALPFRHAQYLKPQPHAQRSWWPEWPSPHDYTSFVWDELEFIPIIGSIAGIEVGSILFFSLLPIKNIYSIAQAFQTPTTYLRPIKTLNLLVTQEQKQCCRKQCYKNNVEVLLQKTMLHRRVEVMLQKQCCRKRCWSGVEENAPPKTN